MALPNSPCGLPTSPRDTRNLAPLRTPGSIHVDGFDFELVSPDSSDNENEKSWPGQPGFVPRRRNRDSLIFVNATVPLSPTSSLSSNEDANLVKDAEPRKKSGLARFFGSCFGKEQRKRRQNFEVEEVKSCHWTEL